MKRELLTKIFKALENETYVIVRWDRAKSLLDVEGDIDIYCEDVKFFADKILGVVNKSLEQEQFIMKISTIVEDEQIHFDVLAANSRDLIFKLDVYQKPPRYKQAVLADKYFYAILNNREQVELEEGIQVNFPSRMNEFLLRYLEYFDKPEKEKHLHFIEENITPAEIVELEAMIEKYVSGRLLEHPRSGYFTKRNILANGE